MKMIRQILLVLSFICFSNIAFSSDSHTHDTHSHNEHENESHESEEEHGDHDDDPEHNDDDHGHSENDEHEESTETRIDQDIAEKVGIKSDSVSSQTLNLQLSSYGALTTSPEQLSHVIARFPGLISSVEVDIGDQVRKGTLLAKIESNDSLQTYLINAPINGIVIQRHANTGEFVSDQSLFSIANFDTLWAELRIYPTHRLKVAAKQHVEFTINNQVVEGEIAHIIPAVNQPYQLARIKIDNTQLGLAPGLLIEGNIAIDKFVASIAVKNEAIQTMEGKDGVFIRSGDNFVFSPLQLGRKDSHYTEVISGITVGQKYVTENSYLIKADIEKSEAEHEH